MRYIFKVMKKNIFFDIYGRILIILGRYTSYRELKKEIKRDNPDILVGYSTYSLSFISNIKGVKKVAWIHGSVNNLYGIFKEYRILKLGRVLSRYERIVVICDEMKEELLDRFPNLKNKVVRVYNSIDISKIKSLSENESGLNESEKKLLKERYIVSVGRLDEGQKDFTTIIKVFSEFSKVEEDIKLVIVGGGTDKGKLEDLVRNIGIADRVVFIGQKKNPFIWMKNADVFLFSSKTEGFGLVLTEAMAVGTPVIATDCKVGPREILKNGEVGRLVKVGAESEMLASLKELFKDSKSLDHLREKSLRRAEEFDVRKISLEIEKLLELERK